MIASMTNTGKHVYRLTQCFGAPVVLANNHRLIEFGQQWTYLCLGTTTTMATGAGSIWYAGESMRVWVILISGTKYMYVHIDAVGAGTTVYPGWCAAVARGLIIPSGVRPCISDVLGWETTTLPMSLANVSLPQVALGRIDSILPRAAITGSHHTHILPSDVLAAARVVNKTGLYELWARLVVTWVGATQATLATWTLWAITADVAISIEVLCGLIYTTQHSVSSIATILKGISVRAKQLQHITELQLEHLFEMDVLMNRGVGKVDWDTERMNRTAPKLVDIPAKDVYRLATKLFAKGAVDGFKHKRLEWSQWWATRWLTVPSGSAHVRTNRLDHTRTMLKREVGFNKKMLVAAVEQYTFDELMALEPALHAWPSTKYEWGKNRAIYGVDTEGFIITDFAMPSCEQSLPYPIMIGAAAEEQHVRQAVKMTTDGLMPMCFDYEDFNSQHSVSSMQAVISAYITVHRERMTMEQIRAALWVRDSIANTYIHSHVENPGPGYTTTGTLLSGWRLTTLVNSVLNWVYLEWAGCLQLASATLHSGDDVLLGLTSMRQAEEIMARARACGIRAQPAKAATGSIAEFLRIDHRATATGSQYLTRSCATAVHARVESDRALSALSLVDATCVRADEMLARGANNEVVQCVLDRQLDFIARIYKTERYVLDKYIGAHPLEGGRNKNACLSGVRIHEQRTEMEYAELPLVKAANPGIRDVAIWLAGRMERQSYYVEIIKLIVETVVRSLTYVRRTIVAQDYRVTVHDENVLNHYGGWRGLVDPGIIALLRGIDPSLMKSSSAAMSRSTRALFANSPNIIRTARIML